MPQPKMRSTATLGGAISRRRHPPFHRRRLIAAGVFVIAAVAASVVWTMSGEGSRHGRRQRQGGVFGSGVALGPGVRWAGRGTRSGAGAAGPSVPATPAPRGRGVTVAVDMSHPGAAVPSDFLGLSFEASELPQIASSTGSSDLAQLLRSLGHGTLRFGGISADTRVAWSQQRALPRWASRAVTARDLAGLATLAGQTGWSVLLTVNLGHYNVTAAAQEAAAARALLGPKLAGIEIGNEPDRFFIKGLRGAGWSFSAYRRQFESYRTAIARAAPGVPIAGPDASSGERVLPWLRASAALHPALLTDHYYPLSRCGYTPVVSDLLGPSIRRGESAMLRSLDAIQRSSAIPLHIDETNNISCKGQPGVSNTFASALWATDYIARAMAAGVRSLDFHDLIDRPGAYSPLVAGKNGLHANPEWYALLLAQRLAGSDALATTVRSAPNLTATGFLGAGGVVQIVLVNFDPTGSTPLLVRLRVPGRFAGGTILRLTAPSAEATSQVKLGGREVMASGNWSARLPLPGIYQRRGSLALAVPASSAALVTLTP